MYDSARTRLLSPSSLARWRPDTRFAEANLHAATAGIGVSLAEFYPDIWLPSQYGLRNVSTSYLFDWASHLYCFGPSISLPIFEGGAPVANVTLSREQFAAYPRVPQSRDYCVAGSRGCAQRAERLRGQERSTA